MTGVQTCALPICQLGERRNLDRPQSDVGHVDLALVGDQELDGLGAAQIRVLNIEDDVTCF